MDHPHAGIHYPRSVAEFQAWFRTDADCLDYLEWLRWPAGFVCPACGRDGGWQLGDGRFMCGGCGGRSSVTAGTIFDRTRTPLTIWFTACWLFATGKDGISALSLKRTLAIGSYQTAWAMLHRLRSVLVRPGRDRLSGRVEVDETYIGGLEQSGYIHQPRSQRAAKACGDDSGDLLPGVHRVASLAKRWLLGTHQGAVNRAHLASYLNEFVFRFNHRRSRSRGMVFYRVLELTVAHEPVRYRDLVAAQRARTVPPTPPTATGHPPSFERPPANRPWRNSG
jgi:hypothetical protein